MIDTKILKNIGFSETESKIYIFLLESGAHHISDIAKYTDSNRVQIYEALPRLIEKKLLGETLKGKRKVYYAENPENLENIFYEQKLSFQNTVSFLKQKYEKNLAKPELRIFYTQEAMRHIFMDVVQTLQKWETYYRYSSRKQDVLRGFLPESYKKIRDEKEIQRCIITSEELKNAKEKAEKKLGREMRAIPKNFDLFDDNIGKIIYGNKVAIIDYNTSMSFIIENKKFAEFEKKVFQLLFRFLRKN